MKADIHPEYHDSKIVCGGCGSEFPIGSVLPQINVGVCWECHPFYTGKSKVLDSEGRVDRFKKKYGSFSAKSSKTQAADAEGASKAK